MSSHVRSLFRLRFVDEPRVEVVWLLAPILACFDRIYIRNRRGSDNRICRADAGFLSQLKASVNAEHDPMPFDHRPRLQNLSSRKPLTESFAGICARRRE